MKNKNISDICLLGSGVAALASIGLLLVSSDLDPIQVTVNSTPESYSKPKDIFRTTIVQNVLTDEEESVEEETDSDEYGKTIEVITRNCTFASDANGIIKRLKTKQSKSYYSAVQNIVQKYSFASEMIRAIDILNTKEF